MSSIDEIWQKNMRDYIDGAKERKERDYRIWQESLILQINCDCNNCIRDKRNWK